MKYRDLRDFVQGLEQQGELCRVTQPVSPHLEMTALADRVLLIEDQHVAFDEAVALPRPRPRGHAETAIFNGAHGDFKAFAFCPDKLFLWQANIVEYKLSRCQWAEACLVLDRMHFYPRRVRRYDKRRNSAMLQSRIHLGKRDEPARV